MILRFGHHQECQISFKDNVKQLFMVSSRHRGEVPSDRATTPYTFLYGEDNQNYIGQIRLCSVNKQDSFISYLFISHLFIVTCSTQPFFAQSIKYKVNRYIFVIFFIKSLFTLHYFLFHYVLFFLLLLYFALLSDNPLTHTPIVF